MFAGEVTTGASGATESTEKLRVTDPPTLPAASVAVTDAACAPCPSCCAAVTVKVQLPDPFAVAVPNCTPSIVTVTVAFASAVPVKVGVRMFTTAFAAGVVIVTDGAWVSTVIETLEARPTFPAASVAVAEIVRAPSLSACAAVGV